MYVTKNAWSSYETVKIAKEVGLEYIVLSDHNTFKQNHHISRYNSIDAIINKEDSFRDNCFTLIPGVELTNPIYIRA